MRFQTSPLRKNLFFKSICNFFTSELFVVDFVGFFPLILAATLLLMFNYKVLLSVTPVSSCCIEIAGMLIRSLEFYPALSELLFLNCFPCFSACMRYSSFVQGALKQSSQGAVLTSACPLLQRCQHNP